MCNSFVTMWTIVRQAPLSMEFSRQEYWSGLPFSSPVPLPDRRSDPTHFPGGSAVKTPPANAGGLGLMPGSGRSPGERNGNPLQYSCLENSMDRGAWRTTVHGFSTAGHALATKQQQICVCVADSLCCTAETNTTL